jgi:two-component system cell cycle sensor histidine kinase/response regulator CckA
MPLPIPGTLRSLVSDPIPESRRHAMTARRQGTRSGGDVTMANPEITPKILIADDSDILNNLMKDVFEENGFEVVQAFDGIECKAVFMQSQPDLAIIDVQMPKLDGIEVLRYIKEKSPRTIVVVMTGVGTEETAVKAMKLGASDYLRKPFAIGEVVSLAEKLLENRKSGEENIRLKKEIRRSEKHLAHLTTIINEALITTDAAGKIQFINRAASNMWGYSSEELKDQDIHFLIRGEARTMLHRDLVRDTLREGKVEGEFLLRRKDKGTFPGYLSTSVIQEAGKATGIVVVVADLTRLYEIESRLKQSEKQAALGRVVEGIAHEVRNSLTSLGGFSLRLQKATASDPACEQYTRIILDDVSRLENMVKDIEDYVRFSKFYTFHFTRTRVLPILERARDKVLRDLPEGALREVRFNLKADRNLPEISADPTALEEIFYNLLLNAYEAMPQGGKLMVSLRNTGTSLSISFTDTGKGIHSEDLADVFNPFFTSKTSGAGMGLSKVYLLVEEHGGIVNVSSEPGKGTTFEIVLPLERLFTGAHSREVIRGHYK